MIDINFQKHLERMLPFHKRQPNRLKLFYWPFKVLQELFNDFKLWRVSVYYRANITGQVLSLQSFLNKTVPGANNKIIVQGYDDQGAWIQLSNEEGDSYVPEMSLASENSNYLELAMEGEVVEDTNTDFYVYIPSSVNRYEVEMVVNNYKIAGKRYQINQTI